MGTKNEKERPRALDFKARTKALMEKYLIVAEELMENAVELAQSGEDIRSNDERPGLATLLHAAQRAVDEIVRLAPMCDEQDVAANLTQFVGLDFQTPKYDETLRDN